MGKRKYNIYSKLPDGVNGYLPSKMNLPCTNSCITIYSSFYLPTESSNCCMMSVWTDTILCIPLLIMMIIMWGTGDWSKQSTYKPGQSIHLFILEDRAGRMWGWRRWWGSNSFSRNVLVANRRNATWRLTRTIQYLSPYRQPINSYSCLLICI